TAALNGMALPLTSGPTQLTAVVEPGPPLRDDNTLEVTATDLDGEPLSLSRTFEYLPPKARVHRITDPADLIRGPLAHGRVGDFLLANDTARFIIQDVQQRDLYSVGAFGGNLIDLELVGHPNLDNFL